MITTEKLNPTVLISLETTDEALQHVQTILPDAEIRIGPWLEEPDMEMDPKLMKGADILLCEQPPENFNDFDQLKWIQLSSSGYSHILHLPLLEKSIRVTNSLGNFDIPIAEWNIMMILMWHRYMLDMLQNQKEKMWDRGEKFQAELRDSVIGFYGYGGLARETARVAKTMGIKCWALTRDGETRKRESVYCVEGTGDPDGLLCDRVFSPNQKQEFFEGLDYLIIALTLTPVTEGIIGEEDLKMLKPSAVIINPARAALIEENVLLKCLTEKWIRGLSLDDLGRLNHGQMTGGLGAGNGVVGALQIVDDTDVAGQHIG